MSVLIGNTAFGSGILLGAASILSVGPNNLMLMREGLQRGRVATLATTVWTSYCALLIAAFVLAKEISVISPGLRLSLSWMGLLVLCLFSLQALLAATTAPTRRASTAFERESWTSCVLRALTVVWCNPLTYVELLLVPAAICETFSAVGSRIEFVIGILMMAALCCYGYSYGGGVFAAFVRHEHTARAFDAASGLLLAGAALLMTVRLASATF